MKASKFYIQINALAVELLTGALEKAKGNKTKAAESLGMRRSTFGAKLRQHGLAHLLESPSGAKPMTQKDKRQMAFPFE